MRHGFGPVRATTRARIFLINKMVASINIYTEMNNIFDKIDAVKANSVSEKEFKSVWGVSLNEHMDKMMRYVRQVDARISQERKDMK